jgi:hypothetical protein
MIDSERSTGTLLLALLGAVLAASALGLSWFTYDASSGRQTPAGGFQDPSDTGVVRHSVTMAPYKTTGDIQPDQPAKAKQLVQAMGIAQSIGAGLLALVALCSVPRISRLMPRLLNLAITVLAGLGIGTALALAWFWLPQTMANVEGPFTAKLVGDTYIRTGLLEGFAVAALALPAAAGAFLFQFQAGSSDPSMVEAYSQGARQ